MRLVGSSHANLFASVSAGINALFGPLHGGANQPVLEMLGIQVGPLVGDAPDTTDAVWDAAERQALQDHIAARRPFLDFVFHQRDGLGLVREFRVSGQPMFDQSCRFQGYRGVGVEMAMRR